MSEPSALLTIDEAAAQLRVSRRTLYSMIEAGEIPTVKLPGTLGHKRPPVRVARAALAAFVARLGCAGILLNMHVWDLLNMNLSDLMHMKVW
jgi:excisionase family DNA binding protein